MTPDRPHSDTVGRVANKVRVEGGFAPFSPYFYVPKYSSSDALPTPEIFEISACYTVDIPCAENVIYPKAMGNTDRLPLRPPKEV